MKEGFIAGTRISQLEANVADYRVKIGEREADLARAAQAITYPQKRPPDIFDLPGIVSRKKQLMPFLAGLLNQAATQS